MMRANSKDIGSPFVIVLGPPAAGKSTLVQAILADHPDVDRFVVRHQLAEEKRNGTDLWRAVEGYAEKGTWIPDTMMVELFARRLHRRCSTGMLLEGLPANGTQAAMVRDLLDAHRVPARVILYLDAPDEVCADRVRGRRVCTRCDDGMAPAAPAPAAPDRCRSCGAPRTRRHDDTDVTFVERLRTHRRNIPAILAAFRSDEVVVLDSTGPPVTVATAARAALASSGW